MTDSARGRAGIFRGPFKCEPDDVRVAAIGDEPAPGALLAQHEQLNIRSRWYSTQLWQIPMAFAGVVALVATELPNLHPVARGLAALGIAATGVLIGRHICSLMNSEERAVRNLKQVEIRLGVGESASDSTKSWTGIVVLVPLITYVAGVGGLIALLAFWIGG